MKILQVVPSLAQAFGGPTNALLKLSSSLSAKGEEVTVFTTNADIRGTLRVPLNKPVYLNNVRIVYFPVDYLPGLKSYKFSLSLAKALKKNIPFFDIVHVHSLFQFSSLAAAYYSRKLNKPYIVKPSGQLDPFSLSRHRFSKMIYMALFERRNLEKASAVHFTSEEERELSKKIRFKMKGMVANLGVDLDEFKNLPPYGNFRNKYPCLKDKKIILFLSRVNFKKGLDVLVKSFAYLAKKRDDIALIIAGPDNEGFSKKVKKWLREGRVEDIAIFTGMVLGKEKLAVLRDSDIFVLPSYSENFGLAVIEAMASGLPVIISNKVNIYPYILNANAGLVINTDYLQLASALERLLQEQHLRKEFSEGGMRLVQRTFCWDNIAEGMIRHYKTIAAADG